MFRELTRKNKQITEQECVDILSRQKRGVLSVLGDEGYPYCMPMNHYYNSDDGCIYFHCGKRGHRLDALKSCDKVCFCVQSDGTKTEGWALEFKSVIVFGKIKVLEDMDTIKDICYKLSLKFTSDKGYIENEIEKFARGTLILKLVPEHICGKRVTEE